MSTSVADFFSKLKGKRIAFIGMGVTNFDIIRLFLKKDLYVTVCDRRKADEIGEKFTELEKLGAKFVLGEKYLSNLERFDIVLRSPGVYYNKEEFNLAREAGTVVTSEMELFFELCP